jgi:hypothetical protein
MEAQEMFDTDTLCELSWLAYCAHFHLHPMPKGSIAYSVWQDLWEAGVAWGYPK